MSLKIAVITPYYKEDTAILRQCHESVLGQAVKADHFLVADGFPNPEAARWDVQHVSLPRAHADFGNTPRAVGGLLAQSEGYDFVAYLDADNWYAPDHLGSLLDVHLETGAPVSCALRSYHQPDGAPMAQVEEADEMAHRHVDTSCYLLERSCFEALDVWSRMPRQISMIGDRVFKAWLEWRRYPFAFTDMKTVAYRTLWKSHYQAAGLPPPPGAKELGNEHAAFLFSVEGVRETVRRLGMYPL